MIKILRYTEYLYLAVAIISVYKIIELWNIDREGTYIFIFFALTYLFSLRSSLLGCLFFGVTTENVSKSENGIISNSLGLKHTYYLYLFAVICILFRNGDCLYLRE